MSKDRKNKAAGAAKQPLLGREGPRSVIASVVCIFGGVLVGFVVLLLLSVFMDGLSVGDAFTGLVTVLGGPFSSGSLGSSMFQFGNMLFQSTPLIMTGLSVAIAFKTGLFNIGAPGQYLMGAMSTLLVALSIPTDKVPAGIVWLLAFIAGIAAGVIWGCIPGLFKAFLGVNEVIVCIMSNWIAANVVSWVFYSTGESYINVAETKMNFIRKTVTNGVSTPTLGLDKLFSNGTIKSYMDIGIFIAALFAVGTYIMINRTTFGFELRACGFNRSAAKYAGMNERRNIVLSMAIAGGLAAGGAALWYLNGYQDFGWNTYLSHPADGFNGIPVALLASNNPIGVIFSSIFLRYISMGGSNLSAQTPFNEYVSELIVAMIIYFSGFSKFIKDFAAARAGRSKNSPAGLDIADAGDSSADDDGEDTEGGGI